MKSLKIIMLLFLSLGFCTAYGQKADTQEQKKAAQPATEQTMTPANQPPAGILEEAVPSPMMATSQSSPPVNTLQPGERDAKTPPEGATQSEPAGERSAAVPTQSKAATQGPSAKDDPAGLKPDEK